MGWNAAVAELVEQHESQAFPGQPGRGVAVGQRRQGRAVRGPGAAQVRPYPVGGVAHGLAGGEVVVVGGQSRRRSGRPRVWRAGRRAAGRLTTRTPTKLADAVSVLTWSPPAGGTYT